MTLSRHYLGHELNYPRKKRTLRTYPCARVRKNNWLSGTIAIVDAEAIKPEHPPTRAVTDGVGVSMRHIKHNF